MSDTLLPRAARPLAAAAPMPFPPGSPYPELMARGPGPADRAVLAAWSRIEASTPLRALRLRRAGALADAALAEAPRVAALGEAAFGKEVRRLRERLSVDGMRPALVACAFAFAREATRRQLGLLHHRVQLLGGAAMTRRALAEMETGEGKTITALLPAAAFALAGRAVHVVTVNDYLAQRDSEQLAGVYRALGLRVGLVVSGQEAAERRAAYRADVTYCTNKDLVFDYLRDRMALGTRRARTRRLAAELAGDARDAGALFLRGLHVAIVDEADSVLIDEARTPLILSGPDGAADDGAIYRAVLAVARQLRRGPDFTIDEARRSLALTDAGRERLAGLAGLGGALQAHRAREELAEQALKALHLFARGADYVLADGKVQIVDEYTGRVMADRTWEAGLHQMIEAKEGCDPSGRRRTLSRITFQRFFSRYGHLCGMTGTAAEARAELSATYGLQVLRVPTHHRLRRVQGRAAMLGTAAAKWDAVAARVDEMSARGRPVLVGTRSVAASERLAGLLRARGMAPAVLNAEQSREEAAVVAQAGQPGCVTVATNMAGRGTDVRLSREVREAGGLHVILTEFHDSARIDRQLFGRCARQGDPGSVEAIIAADDELFGRFAGRHRMRGVRLGIALARRCGAAGLESRLVARLVLGAQRRAERMNAGIRRQTMREDERLERSLGFAGQGE